VADDSNDTDREKEIDDLSSFGPLSSPDTEGSGLTTEVDPTEADLASLASSAKANKNGQPELLSTEDDLKIDLSKAVETIGDETVPVKETDSEQIEQLSGTSEAQPPPKTDTDVQDSSESERTEKDVSNRGQKRWVSTLSIGFLLGLATAAISIFIFISMDRFQSNALISSSSTSTGPNQRTAMQPPLTQPLDLSNPNPRSSESTEKKDENPATRPHTLSADLSNPAPSESAKEEDENRTTRLHSLSSRGRSSRRTRGRAPTSVRTRGSAKKPIYEAEETRSVAKAANQAISTSREPEQSARKESIDPAVKTSVASSPKSEQPIKATSKDLDKIIDGMLDATKEDNIKRSIALKESQKNAPQTTEELPLVPSREQVTQAMAVLLPAIRGCAKGLSGLATANIIVLDNGKVASVTVSGSPFAGTTSGHCIEGVVRKARFPRFRQPSFRIRFPFSIRNVPK